jgi:hypothetical protein
VQRSHGANLLISEEFRALPRQLRHDIIRGVHPILDSGVQVNACIFCGEKMKTAVRRRKKGRRRISRPDMVGDRSSPPLASLPLSCDGGHRSSLDPDSNATPTLLQILQVAPRSLFHLNTCMFISLGSSLSRYRSIPNAHYDPFTSFSSLPCPSS